VINRLSYGAAWLGVLIWNPNIFWAELTSELEISKLDLILEGSSDGV
jgi:hypothetical protein